MIPLQRDRGRLFASAACAAALSACSAILGIHPIPDDTSADGGKASDGGDASRTDAAAEGSLDAANLDGGLDSHSPDGFPSDSERPADASGDVAPDHDASPLTPNQGSCKQPSDCASGWCISQVCVASVISAAIGDGTYDLNTRDHAIAWNADGNLVAAGTFFLPIGFGNNTGTLDPGSTPNAFLVALSPTSVAQWAKPIAKVGRPIITHVATDAAGGIAVAGWALAVDLGKGVMSSPGGSGVLVAKYDHQGNLQWGKLFGGGSGAAAAQGVAAYANGDVVITGSFSSPTIAFGGPTLDNTSSGKSWTFVARLAGSDGSHVWSAAYGDPGASSGGADVAIDPGTGDVVLAGYFSGSINLGGATLQTTGSQDAFLASLSSDGKITHFTNQIDGSGNIVGTSVAIDPSGDVLVAGEASASSIDFGNGSSVPCGTEDVFAGKYRGGTGAYVWAGCFLDGSITDDPAIDSDRAGNAFVAGRFSSSSMSVPGFVLSNASTTGTNDIFTLLLRATDGVPLGARAYGTVGDDFAQAVAVNRVTGDMVMTGGFTNAFTIGAGSTMPGSMPDSLFIASLGTAP